MNTALLVVDVQNDYFRNGNMELVGSLEASENIRSLLDSFRKKGKPVLHVQHVASREGATFFRPGTRGVEIHENAAPIDGEPIIVKNYPNGFRKTELHQICMEKGITGLVIVGMMTHMCIDTTVRAAFDLGYECTVISDCCSTRDLSFRDETIPSKSVQASFLAALHGTFANVITMEEYARNHAMSG